MRSIASACHDERAPCHPERSQRLRQPRRPPTAALLGTGEVPRRRARRTDKRSPYGLVAGVAPAALVAAGEAVAPPVPVAPAAGDVDPAAPVAPAAAVGLAGGGITACSMFTPTCCAFFRIGSKSESCASASPSIW